MHISLFILLILLLSVIGPYLLELLVIHEYTPINAELFYSKTKDSSQKASRLGLTGSLKNRYLEYLNYTGALDEKQERRPKISNLYEESQYINKFPLRRLKGRVTGISKSMLIRKKSSLSLGALNIVNNDLYNLIKPNPNETEVALYYYYDREVFGLSNSEHITPIKEWMLCFEDKVKGKILGSSLDRRKENLTLAIVKQGSNRKHNYFIKVYNNIGGLIDKIEKKFKRMTEEILKGEKRENVVQVCPEPKERVKRIYKTQICFKDEKPLSQFDHYYFQMRNYALEVKRNTVEFELKPKSIITSLDRHEDLIVYSVLNDNLIFRSYIWSEEVKNFMNVESFQTIVSVNRTIFYNLGVKVTKKNKKNNHQMVSFYVTGNSEELYLRGSIFYLNKTSNNSDEASSRNKSSTNTTNNRTGNASSNKDTKQEQVYVWEHFSTFLSKSIEGELKRLDYSNPFYFPQAQVIYEEEQNLIVGLLLNEYLVIVQLDSLSGDWESRKSYLYRLEKLKKENFQVLKIEMSSDLSYLYLLTKKDDMKFIMIIKVNHQGDLPESLEIYRIKFKETDHIEERALKDLKIIGENSVKDVKIMIALFEEGDLSSFQLSSEGISSDMFKDLHPFILSFSFFLLITGIIFICEGIRRFFRRGMSLRVRLMMSS